MVTPPPALSRTERYEIPNEVPFPLRLHIMLQHTESAGQAHIVSWMPSGKSFRVHDRDAFSKEILPEYFRSNNFRSFQRNLSVYQFARIWSGPEKGAYCHQNFVRHDRKLCTQIKRHVAQKKEPPDNPEKFSSGETRTTPTFDDGVMVNSKAEFHRRIQMNKEEQPPSWNATTANQQEQGGTLLTSRRCQQAALAPLMIPNKQGHSFSTSQPSYSVSTAAGGVGGDFRFGSQQQSDTSQSSFMFQRGSLSLESSNSGFLAGYHNELRQAAMAEGGSSLSCRESYDLSPAVNNLLLLQQQLSMFSSNSNASAPPGGGLDHHHGSRFMKVSSCGAGTADLPTSPGPQSFEDDDPFLLDRLWSQTLKMTMTAKNPLVAVRPRSMGYEQQEQQATTTTIWGSPAPSSNTSGATHNFSTLQQSSSSTNKRNTTSFTGGKGSASGTTTTTTGSFGARFHGDEDMGTGRTTDMVIHDDLVDSRGELFLLRTTSKTTTPAVGEYQGGGVHFYDNTRRVLGGMSLLSTMTGSSCSGSDGGVRSEGDSAAHHRRHQQLLQEEEVNSIPAPSDGSGGGDCNKQGPAGASSSSTSSSSSSEQGYDSSRSRNNNDNYQDQVQGRNLGTRNMEDEGLFRDIW